MQDLNNIVTNLPQKGLVTDLSENLVSKEIWTHARNAQMHSHLGQVQFLQNEPSNIACVDIPYTAIGTIKILGNKWIIFSTDNINSEIGIFDEQLCTYTKIVNDPCLNFKTTNLILGQSKENFDCTESIYWTDNLNPRRTLNINNIPYQYTFEDDACLTKKYNDKLACDELLLEPKISVPHIDARLGFSGNLKNGVYQFAIAYANNSARLSEFYSVTKPVRIWTHENLGQSINLTLSNLDREFDQFELAVIYSKDETSSYYSLGFHSTATTSLTVTSVSKNEFTPLALEDIIIKRPRYPYAELVSANDQYLLWGNLTTAQELNYQKTAMNITTKYILYKVPSDYYKKGGIEVGYERDEVYSFGIQWLYADGSWSPAYHIPGRKATKIELGLANGSDVYETEVEEDSCGEKIKIAQWQVRSTAGLPTKLRNIPVCNEVVIADGKLGYFESNEKYPDNTTLYDQDACLPIRHHKMPDNTISHIYSDNGKYINILGVQFDNIEHPKDENGKYIDNIIGYRIVRGDRSNNRTIIAKGLVSNVRGYKEPDGTNVMYANYPYNDLRPDGFISSKQTKGKAGGESNFSPVSTFYNERFNFYGPHTLFSNTSLGTEFKVYTEEIAQVKGQFQPVYKHPGLKLLTQFDLYFALIIGALDGYYATKGKKCTTVIGDAKTKLVIGGGIPTPSGPTLPTIGTVGIDAHKMEQACDDALAFTSTTTVDKKQLKVAERILRTLARVGVFAYFTLQTAQKVLDIIAESNPWQYYGKQYNSVGNFNSFKKVEDGNSRRYINHYQYVRDSLNTINAERFNNFKREPSVYLELHKGISTPSTKDNSRNTMAELGICNAKDTIINTQASMYYTAIKRKMPNQYGTIDSINYQDTGYLDTNLKSISASDKELIYKSGPVFGGDTFINRMSVKRSHNYFSLFLHDVNDGYTIDYRNYRNVGFPRYWVDSSRYNLSSFVSLRPTLGRTPANKHNLDCGADASTSVSVVSDDRSFYLFNSGVINFFVESDYNLDFRDWKNEESTFYSDTNADINHLFRSDKISKTEEFLYDRTFSKQLKENYIPGQSINFTVDNCQTNQKNKIIYSMPAAKEQKADNWRNYLALNFHEFPMTDFGELTGIHSIDNQQFMFLFDKSSPYVSIGRDELQLDGSGKKITLGDGGLFSRDPRPIGYTDYYYGNSQSRFSFINTQFGTFYPSQRQGRIFRYANQLDEITKNGMHFWFKNNLPSKLLTQFPNFIHKDNIIEGVGLTSVFDNTFETFYISKKDYSLKEKFQGSVTYNASNNTFSYNGTKISLKDTNYFDDASWTISYDPKTQSFISYHDWIPEWTIQSENHFFTIKDKTIWKHNREYDSFCKFYNKDYPFEVEYLVNNGNNVEILRSIEYILDAGKYFNEGRDFHQILDYNFDRLVVHNNEQISGELKLNLQSKKDLTQFFNYPKINPANNYIDILYNKEEQRTRINQFTDITKDRGEFTHKNYPLWITKANGYDREVNQQALNYLKPVQHQKKFRSLWHKILLKKLINNDIKMIFKITNSKETISPR